MNNCCALCGGAVYGRINGIPAYWCTRCYKEWQTDIVNNAPWVSFLLNSEKQHRKRRNRDRDRGHCDPISLDTLTALDRV
jgi:hypothetical protein